MTNFLSSEISLILDKMDAVKVAGDEKKSFTLDEGWYQQSQIRHKLKRVLTELKYAEANKKKFLCLTDREKEIIKLIVNGYNNPDISKILYISRRTVEQHRKNINRKLNLRSLAEICDFAKAFDMD